MKYIVVELQTYTDGTFGHLVWDYDKIAEAESKYYTVMAAAAISEVPIHACSLLDATGRLLLHAYYDRRSAEPVPEPEE